MKHNFRSKNKKVTQYLHQFQFWDAIFELLFFVERNVPRETLHDLSVQSKATLLSIDKKNEKSLK